MTTTRRRWPTSANAARLLAIRNCERVAEIARELVAHPDVRRNDRLAALTYEAMALAERTRRELGEAQAE